MDQEHEDYAELDWLAPRASRRLDDPVRMSHVLAAAAGIVAFCIVAVFLLATVVG